MKKACFGLYIGLALVFSQPAFAHYLSVYVDNYHPKPGEAVTITMGYGHTFPETVLPKIEKIERIYLVGPDGRELPLTMKTQGEDHLVQPVVHTFDKAGTYLFVAERKSYFLCKTTDGYKYQPKKDLQNVLSSSWSEANAMAVINVGQPAGEAFRSSLDKRFQLMALADPGILKKGDHFMANVLLDGKPSHATLFAVAAGAADPKKSALPPETKDGTADIHPLSQGAWLVKASEKYPYPKTEDADQYSFTSTLTFGIY